jgi:hypothetical protein
MGNEGDTGERLRTRALLSWASQIAREPIYCNFGLGVAIHPELKAKDTDGRNSRIKTVQRRNKLASIWQHITVVYID